MITTTLDGSWRLKAVSPMKYSNIAQGSEWDMIVPGSLHDTFLANGIISEPYDGDEIIRTSWIGESTWSLERKFTAEKGKNQFFIKCGGLSTSCLAVNGKLAAKVTEDTPLLADITEYVKDGENSIEIIFQGNPLSEDIMSFPCVWRSVKLLSDPTLIIAGCEAECERKDGRWKLNIVLSCIAKEESEAAYSISVNGKTHSGRIMIPEGEKEHVISIDPGDVSIWWPNGMGAQPVYPVSIEVNGYQTERKVVFRTVTLIQEGLFVNEKRIYLKGATLGKANLIQSRTDQSYLERLTRSAAEANMNTLLLRTYYGKTLRDAAARSGLLVFSEEEANSIPKALSAPSFPSKETLERIWKNDERNISSAAADLHGEGAGRILQGIADSFLFPVAEDKLVYLSEAKAAEAATRKASEQRVRGNHGMILSSLTDPWPEISDSAIEYGGKWKLLQYAARRFFSPLSPMILISDKTVTVYFVNDTTENAEAEFSIKIRDFSGTKKETREYTVPAASGECVKVAEYPLHRIDPLSSFMYVKMSTKDVLRERTTLLDKPKKVKLEDPKLEVSTMQNGPRIFSVKLSVRKPAFFVALDTPVKGLFSDNFISVRPSAEKTIFFRTEEDVSLDEFTSSLKVMDLYKAMH